MAFLLQENGFLKKYRHGVAPVGFFNYIKDPTIMYIASETGLDFVIIDTEHAVMDRVDVERQIIAAQRNGLTPMVRMPDTIPYLMRSYMEQGAKGVLVPHIHSKEEAQRGQDALRYAPEGTASCCRSIHSDGFNAAHYMEYLEWVKDVAYIPMIEDPEGLAHLDEILDVLKPGRDFVLFGKADYGQALGTLRPDGSIDPAVIDAYHDVIRICKKRGIGVMGCPSTSPEGQSAADVKKVIEEGTSAVVLNTDQQVISEGFRRIIGSCQDGTLNLK